jgi:hypothetical protein
LVVVNVRRVMVVRRVRRGVVRRKDICSFVRG